MRKRRAEVRAVDGVVTGGLRAVDVLTAAAVKLDGFLERDVDKADGKEGLRVAEDSGAAAEVATLALCDLEKQVGREDGWWKSEPRTLEMYWARTIFAIPRGVKIHLA
jgi:hypothetical protein